MWEVNGDKDRLLFWPKVFLAHSNTSFSSWLGLLNHGSLRAQSPLCSWLSLRHFVSNWLEPSGHLVILLSKVHLLPLFFRLFTQVHLLIDGSVEGQYITYFSPNKAKLLFSAFFFNSWTQTQHETGYFEKGIAPFPTPRCSSYWKESLWLTPNCSC